MARWSCDSQRCAGAAARMAPRTCAARHARGVARPAGRVGLPLHVFWSGGDPASVRWDLADSAARRSLYEIVLQQGGVEELRALINGPELVRLWPSLYLPRWVRAAWSELIASATSAA